MSAETLVVTFTLECFYFIWPRWHFSPNFKTHLLFISFFVFSLWPLTLPRTHMQSNTLKFNRLACVQLPKARYSHLEGWVTPAQEAASFVTALERKQRQKERLDVKIEKKQTASTKSTSADGDEKGLPWRRGLCWACSLIFTTSRGVTAKQFKEWAATLQWSSLTQIPAVVPWLTSFIHSGTKLRTQFTLSPHVLDAAWSSHWILGMLDLSSIFHWKNSHNHYWALYWK